MSPSTHRYLEPRVFSLLAALWLFTLPAVAGVTLVLQQWLAGACASVLAVVHIGCVMLIQRSFLVDAHACGMTCGKEAASEEKKASARQSDVVRQRVDELYAALPRTVDGAGYLYAVVFSTSIVKVGQTVNPQQRLRQHRSEAAAYGVDVIDVWLSPPHTNYLANEVTLINHCRGLGRRLRSEYFRGANPTAVVAYASALPMEVLPS